MIKRLFDIVLSLTGLVVASPILLPTMLAVWLKDYHNPFYMAPRVGRNEKTFTMVKMRSMVINADKSVVDSTSNDDQRITRIGKFILGEMF